MAARGRVRHAGKPHPRSALIVGRKGQRSHRRKLRFRPDAEKAKIRGLNSQKLFDFA